MIRRQVAIGCIASLLPVVLLPPRPAAAAGTLAALPGGGGSVRDDRTDGRLRQRIALKGSGTGRSDRIEVELRPAGLDAGDGLAKPTAGGIAVELGRRFPGETTQVVRTPLRNGYGLVGHAVGGRCLYAWRGSNPKRSIREAAARAATCRCATNPAAT